MGFFRRKAASRITRDQAMEGCPVRNPSIESTSDEDGEVSLKIPRRRTWWINLLAKWGRIPDYRVIALDEIGAGVWENCDGEHSVKDLIALHAEKYQLSRKEAEMSMIVYLRQLARRGIIVLVVDEELEEKKEQTVE